MIDFSFQNTIGNSVQVTNNETKYKLEEITGLTGFERNVNLLELAGQDGSIYNSSKIPSREIVVTVSIVGNVENNRLDLLKVVRDVRDNILFFKTDNRHVYIEGKPRTADANPFSEKQTMQIAFTCPNPFFRSYNYIETSIDKGTDYTTVTNGGDISAGFRAVIGLTNISNNPTQITLEKQDRNGTHKIIVNYADGFESGDVITIDNSYSDNIKNVVLTRNQQKINLISGVDRIGTEWFGLAVGSNNIRYKVGNAYSYSGTGSCTIRHNNQFLAL